MPMADWIENYLQVKALLQTDEAILNASIEGPQEEDETEGTDRLARDRAMAALYRVMARIHALDACLGLAQEPGVASRDYAQDEGRSIVRSSYRAFCLSRTIEGECAESVPAQNPHR